MERQIFTRKRVTHFVGGAGKIYGTDFHICIPSFSCVLDACNSIKNKCGIVPAGSITLAGNNFTRWI